MGIVHAVPTQLALESHPTATVNNESIFAQKLLKPFSGVSEGDILNEFRAIKKLCLECSHENIITIYNYGKLSDSLYYYIDMEFCSLNLEEYIYEPGMNSSSTSRRSPSLLPLHTRTVLQI